MSEKRSKRSGFRFAPFLPSKLGSVPSQSVAFCHGLPAKTKKDPHTFPR
jgi:hypothetical protein